MDNLDIKKMPKNDKKICCEKCKFICFKKSNYEKHLSTPKHSKIILEDNKNEKIFICKCGKIYKYLSGLSKHKKTCNLKESNTEKLLTESNIIMLLIKENQEFKKIMIEQNQKNQELMIEQNQKNQELIMELASKTTTINNNNCNNKFNMNIFLNEQCKDAMNIMDFVSSLKISFEDLENVGEVGYVKGITNIISNGLNKLDVHKRPIHCSDVKREVFYVKDNDVWEKETEDKKKITRAIKHISYNTARKVTPWTELPENEGVYDYYNKLNDKYSRISSQANGGDPDEVAKIIKNIACKVTIDKESLDRKVENF